MQTIFAGKKNDEAPAAPGLSVLGDLLGPGIDTPITLATKPGHAFQLPGLHEKGEYTLQNIRLVNADGEFLQQAVPSFAVVQVSDVLKTTVRVRQLTAAELRERGINVDSRNYEVYEYTFVFGVDQSTVEVPYAVLVDKRTRVLQPVIADPYQLPPLGFEKPPRFTPPQTHVFDLGQGGVIPGSNELDKTPPAPPSIPAALVVPNGFGVLHQFFAVILHVDNAASDGSEIRLDSVTASIAAPLSLRVAKVMPAVSVGQPVPIVDEVTGATFLVAGGKGSAEWTLEALKTGTHTVNIEVNATYHKPGQDDFPLRGSVATSLVVSDPRFHINFSHPETVRKDEPYTAYTFITNLSPQRQHVRLDTNDIPRCSSGGAFENICRTTGDGIYELDIEPGEMATVPYALSSKINGKVFAAAGSANDEAVAVSVKLTMGVSATGIPLSPATLVMPYYTRFLPADFVDAQMRLLGLGYSLSTAPLNQYTARLPRVIKTDVFTRAQQIARAGQRTFITNPTPNHDAMPHLALDLLGNTERVDQLAITPDLQEWDELRRTEDAGRVAAAAMTRELERTAATPRTFVDNFAASTSHRAPYMLAYVHGPPVNGHPRPYALSIAGVTSETLLDVHAEAGLGWTRTLPYAELTRLNLGGDAGELAIVGRWKENLRVVVLPQTSAFTLHLLYPDTADGAMLRADVDITGATVGSRMVIELARGARSLNVQYATGTATIAEVGQTLLAVSAAAQDLYLDDTGHVVTMLFNRPVTLPAGAALRDRLALTINVPKANYTVTRRNTAGAELQIPGAVIQADGRIVTLTFDKTLSRNANYEIALDAINDLLTGASFSKTGIIPRIDNDRPGSILTGRVLRADNTPVPGVLVQLSMKDVPVTSPDGTTLPRDIMQHDVAGADGRFLFEFVPRDLDSGIFGLYDLETESPEGMRTSVSGAVRLPGEVHTANLVFLGRGRATGQVRYDDGTPIPNVVVTIGSTLHAGLSTDITDPNGRYDIDGLPVAPLTFSVVDPDGRTTFAANHLRTPGEVLTQDLVVLRREAPGRGTVRLTVKRSDTNAPVAGAVVGVSSQGYPLQEALTDANGRAEFRDIPAGLVTMLASAWSISAHSAAVELDLRAD
ncbi:MAG TPA: carboxypeptidase-like regulatory domain-containing protein, partial [Thermoanaerobaculia bacterium]